MKQPPVTAICHFAFLVVIALYLGAYYPACRTLAVLVVLGGAAVEFIPRHFQKPLIPEILLATCVAVGWWSWPQFGSASDLYHAVGMIVAYLLLIPSGLAQAAAANSRTIVQTAAVPGRLRWVLGLAILEVVFGPSIVEGDLAAVVVITIGFMALAVDHWLVASAPAQEAHPGRPHALVSLLRWAILPVLLVAAGALMIGTPIMDATAGYHAARGAARVGLAEEPAELIDLQETMSLGDHRSVERDPRILAKLTWESGPAPTGLLYLRSLALPDLVISGPEIRWLAEHGGEHRTFAAIAEPKRWAQVERVASSSDVVLRPDGEIAVELPELATDAAGNLYSAALANRAITYRVGFDDLPRKADPAEAERCLEYDPILDALPWDRFEDPGWRAFTPEEAAAQVCSRLQDYCSYELQDLPPPMAGPGGVLRGFLFGPTLEARRGHCQYFASAAVLLLRRAGHPARCVGGFASDEIDPGGIVFRALHFHAWIEVINSRGEWQRFDPSPDSRLARHLAGVQLPAAKALQSEPPGRNKPERVGSRIRRLGGQTTPMFWAAAAGGLALLAAAYHWRGRFSATARRLDPRVMELQRRHDDLLKVAASLGIIVTPATTLTQLVAALESRTRLSLETPLRAHLAARFGRGPLPDPWPLDALVEAAKVN